jgi:L-aspartate semialdehyde sulfurtransferase ferredoxin
MATRRLKLTFPRSMITSPVIYRLGKEYNLVTNIRRADITHERGWVILELDGSAEEIDKAIEAVLALGIGVDSLEGEQAVG